MLPSAVVLQPSSSSRATRKDNPQDIQKLAAAYRIVQKHSGKYGLTVAILKDLQAAKIDIQNLERNLSQAGKSEARQLSREDIQPELPNQPEEKPVTSKLTSSKDGHFPQLSLPFINSGQEVVAGPVITLYGSHGDLIKGILKELRQAKAALACFEEKNYPRVAVETYLTPYSTNRNFYETYTGPVLRLFENDSPRMRESVTQAIKDIEAFCEPILENFDFGDSEDTHPQRLSDVDNVKLALKIVESY